jgi:hypothetical protein
MNDWRSRFQLLGGRFQSRWVWFRARISSISQRWGWRVWGKTCQGTVAEKKDELVLGIKEPDWAPWISISVGRRFNLRAGSWIWDSTVLQPTRWVIALAAVVQQPVAFSLGHWEAVGSLRHGKTRAASDLAWVGEPIWLACTDKEIHAASKAVGEARFQALAKGQSLLSKARQGNF